jgi:hypothetical protein
MTSKKLRRLRHEAYEHQHSLCFYCRFPMWENNPEDFSRAYGIPSRLRRHQKCTAEHLLAHQDNGEVSAENIVAACLWCNTMRHFQRPHKAPKPNCYQSKVLRLVALGRWHPLAASQNARMHALEIGGLVGQIANLESSSDLPCQTLENATARTGESSIPPRRQTTPSSCR